MRAVGRTAAVPAVAPHTRVLSTTRLHSPGSGCVPSMRAHACAAAVAARPSQPIVSAEGRPAAVAAHRPLSPMRALLCTPAHRCHRRTLLVFSHTPRQAATRMSAPTEDENGGSCAVCSTPTGASPPAAAETTGGQQDERTARRAAASNSKSKGKRVNGEDSCFLCQNTAANNPRSGYADVLLRHQWWASCAAGRCCRS